MSSYCTLNEKSRYLKQVETQGASQTLRSDEITRCEEYATAIIEGSLGKSFAPTAIPDLIVDIADMLASAKAYFFLHTGQQPAKSEYAETLDTKAMSLLEKIKNGDIGLKNDDGTWDEDYPGASNKEDDLPEGIRIII